MGLDFGGKQEVCLVDHVRELEVHLIAFAECGADLDGDVDILVALEKAHSPTTHLSGCVADLCCLESEVLIELRCVKVNSRWGWKRNSAGKGWEGGQMVWVW